MKMKNITGIDESREIRKEILLDAMATFLITKEFRPISREWVEVRRVEILPDELFRKRAEEYHTTTMLNIGVRAKFIMEDLRNA